MDKIKGVRPKNGGIEIRFTYQKIPYSFFLNKPYNRTNQAEACRIKRQKLEELRAGQTHDHIRADNPLLQEVAQDYMDSIRTRLSEEYCYKVKQDLNNIWLPELGLLGIKNIRPRHCRIADDKWTWPSPKRQQNGRSVLRQLFQFAVDDDLIEANPVRKLKAVTHQKPDIDPFTAEEKEAILKALTSPQSVFYFTLAFETGMRTGELLGLHREDFRGGKIHLSRTLRNGKYTTLKTKRERSVALSPRAREAWERAVLPLKGPIWVDKNGPILSSRRFWRAWRTALTAANVRYRRPYNTRHTRASLGMAAGQTPMWLARQLGNDLRTFFGYYVNFNESDTDDMEMAKLAQNHEVGKKLGQES